MRVGIVGAGFAGLAAAIAFRNDGHDVCVFEKAGGPSRAGGAISLAPNALGCLTVLGLHDRIATHRYSPVPATVRTATGEVLIRSTLSGLTGGGDYATVPRSDLIGWLTERLPDGCVRYSHPVSRVTVDGSIECEGSVERFDLVVGADGPRGVVRRSLWPKAPALRSTGGRAWAWTTDCELRTGFGTIWGRSAHFGILPLGGGRTYVYGGSAEDVELSYFRDWPAPLPMLIDGATPDRLITPEIFEARPPQRLSRGKVVLIGDAAHTMQPTFGQGAAIAMEDALTLASRGTAGLSRRWPRMLALYGMSKAGALFAAPRLAPLERARNLALRITPDQVFGFTAGSVSHWRPALR